MNNTNRSNNRNEIRRNNKKFEGARNEQRRDIRKKDIYEESAALDRLEGRNSVMEALKSNRTINKILVAKGERGGSINKIIAIAKDKGIVIQEVEKSKLDNESTTFSHQGVIAYVSVKEYVEIEDILKISKERGEEPFLIILDEITDPQNLGSILRTADAVGAHGVIIPKRRAVGLSSVVSKASAGAVEYVPVARVSNIVQAIESLKKRNVWIVGTEAGAEKAFYQSDLLGPIAIVVGNEGEGIGRLIKEKCDFLVKIPMMGKISSLNAAVAGSVMMYEVLKQRNSKC